MGAEPRFVESVPLPVARGTIPIVDSLEPQISRVTGRPGWALAIGLVTGALGGAAMLLVASVLAASLGAASDVDVVRTVGAPVASLAGDAVLGGWAVAVALGAVVGLLFGGLLRHVRRLLPRVLSGVLLAPTLWTMVHAFVLKSFAPSLAALPFGPMIAGAACFGLCASVVRPPPRTIVVSR